MNFSYVNTTKIFFGQGKISSITDTIDESQKVLVIYGGGSVKKNGVYQQVEKALKGHRWIEFSGVETNPSKETMDKAVAIIKKEKVDFILAVGGGSVIDGSKYAAAAAHYDGDGWDILTGNYKPEVATPIGVILTIPATGSESNPNSVITSKETQRKLPFAAECLQPKFAVMDPEVMKTLPDNQLVNGIVDAWIHVCEQYITKSVGALIQDGYSEVLLRALKNLGDNYKQRDDHTWRANLMWTANQALNGLISVGVEQDWATHIIGHELTAIWHIDHARSLAIVQPSLLRNQIEFKREKLEQMGRNVFALDTGLDLAERTIEEIEKFYRSLGVSTQLTEHSGDKEASIDLIIRKLESHGRIALTENQNVTLVEIREILENAVS